MSKKDPYSILGVSKGAGKTEIKKAYRSLAMKYHPDRSPGKESEEKFKEASEAADILLDDEKRRLYDRFGYEG
ncbi:MAG: DnaJ domain-containing protein, partial [Bdellovibrionota bacterium]|nr:DnaJ domain-containing protein [Bdellovibrionota bacterium]